MSVFENRFGQPPLTGSVAMLSRRTDTASGAVMGMHYKSLHGAPFLSVVGVVRIRTLAAMPILCRPPGRFVRLVPPVVARTERSEHRL